MIINGFRRGRRLAASTVEFAFVVPVFLLLLVAILEYSRYLFAYQVMLNAAREGARYAVVNTNTLANSDVQTYVDTYLVNQGRQLVSYSASSNISVYQADPTTGLNTGLSWTSTGFGTSIGVTVSGTYTPIVPGLLKLTGTLPITASCVMTTEAN